MSPENQNLWFTKPASINLKEFISRPKFEQASLDLTYSKHMTAIDGIQPDIAENVREMGFEAREPTEDCDPASQASAQERQGSQEVVKVTSAVPESS